MKPRKNLNKKIAGFITPFYKDDKLEFVMKTSNRNYLLKVNPNMELKILSSIDEAINLIGTFDKTRSEFIVEDLSHVAC